jgi:transcriptional regulator with XRE-family HTH domain
MHLMPRRSQRKLPPLDLGKETMGERLARIRKERGVTQVVLAEKIGIIQGLVSAYERDRIRLPADMAIRIAQALQVSADELLGLQPTKTDGELSLRLSRRLRGIETLPAAQQKALFQTIDAFLKNTG